MLTLPLFRGAQVVAGRDHLDNRVTWINLMEILDSFDQLQPGEFLISTGYGLKDDATTAQAILSQLASRRIAGLALQPGYYIDEIPGAFVEAAENKGLPLIRLPAKLTFGTITKALFDAMGALPSEQGGETTPLRRQSTHHLTERLRDTFIDDLLEGRDAASYSDTCIRADSLGFRLDLPYQVGVIRFFSGHSLSPADGEAPLLQAVTEDRALFPAAYWRHREREHVLLFSTTARNAKSLFVEALRHLLPKDTACLMGIGYPSAKLEGISKSYEEARIAADLGRHLHCPALVTAFRDVEALHLLRACRNGEELQHFCERVLAPLVDYDRKHRAPLRETLQRYLQSLNKIRTSQELFIHRQTLAFRLRKIEEITGRNLESADDRLILELGLAAESLLSSQTPPGEAWGGPPGATQARNAELHRPLGAADRP